MEEQLISLETAKLTKEKGFDEMCDNHYCYSTSGASSIFMDALRNSEHSNNELTAPTQSLLQKWLREIHNINVYCVCRVGEWTYWIDKTSPLSQESTTYEKALEEGLQEGLNLI